ncbi:unnamed protein product, partial [Oikopleura dioica]
ASRQLQVGFLRARRSLPPTLVLILTSKQFQSYRLGRKRENIQFVDAVVDKSLGNIRENIRKSANQKHVSTSMVDPVKEMRKNDPNAHVSKRTHQLKYLVELAKANETRLNQLWSNAKSSSRTTAMKYGW